jgi:hypothetical protein
VGGNAVGDTARRLHRKPSFEETSVPRVIEYCDKCVGFGLEVRQQDTVVVQPRTYDRQKICGCNFRRTRDAHRDCFPGSPHDARSKRAGERKVPLRGRRWPISIGASGLHIGSVAKTPTGHALRRYPPTLGQGTFSGLLIPPLQQARAWAEPPSIRLGLPAAQHDEPRRRYGRWGRPRRPVRAGARKAEWESPEAKCRPVANNERPVSKIIFAEPQWAIPRGATEARQATERVAEEIAAATAREAALRAEQEAGEAEHADRIAREAAAEAAAQIARDARYAARKARKRNGR